MSGGYLTLDFSDVEFKGGDDLAGFTLGYKKGIYNYIKKTGKPIYIIFSPSVMKALYNYYGEGTTEIIFPKKSIYLLQPIFVPDINMDTRKIFAIGQYSTSIATNTSLDALDTLSLQLIFTQDDKILIAEM